ncbi:hypothetical protein COB55_03940 [Candidatus Wolfebacteria bacterium]|nr:MAG: hypothetical protein COB55_03940 [Candidatus Wolfebacteria bacterium]
MKYLKRIISTTVLLGVLFGVGVFTPHNVDAEESVPQGSPIQLGVLVEALFQINQVPLRLSEFKTGLSSVKFKDPGECFPGYNPPNFGTNDKVSNLAIEATVLQDNVADLKSVVPYIKGYIETLKNMRAKSKNIKSISEIPQGVLIVPGEFTKAMYDFSVVKSKCADEERAIKQVGLFNKKKLDYFDIQPLGQITKLRAFEGRATTYANEIVAFSEVDTTKMSRFKKIARSVAKPAKIASFTARGFALGRQAANDFVVMSLDDLTEEARLRGHAVPEYAKLPLELVNKLPDGLFKLIKKKIIKDLNDKILHYENILDELNSRINERVREIKKIDKEISRLGGSQQVSNSTTQTGIENSPQSIIDDITSDGSSSSPESTSFIVPNDYDTITSASSVVTSSSSDENCFVFTQTMVLGSSDSSTYSEVSRLQEDLHGSGYYPSGGVTGNFDLLTEEAVKNFQTGQGFDFAESSNTNSFGTVGPNTREAMFSECTSGSNSLADNNLRIANTPVSQSTTFRRTFYAGVSEKLAVTPKPNGLTQDQINEIVNLLRVFNVPSDQISEIQTTLSVTSGFQTASQVNTCVPFKRTLYRGKHDNGTYGEVSRLQELLNKLGHHPTGEVNGIFGPKTEKAVKSFQRAEGLASRGSFDTNGFGGVGPKTREVLSERCNEINSVPVKKVINPPKKIAIPRVIYTPPPIYVAPTIVEPAYVAPVNIVEQPETISPVVVAPEPEPDPVFVEPAEVIEEITTVVIEVIETSASTSGATASITKPSSGTTVAIGSKVDLGWRVSSTTDVPAVTFALLKNGSVITNIVSNLGSQYGGFLWTVPSLELGQYTIRISDSSNSSVKSEITINVVAEVSSLFKNQSTASPLSMWERLTRMWGR